MACCYSGCSNTRKKNPDLTFFRFPKERYRSYLWIKKCCNSNIENLSHYELQYRVVCEEHFSSRCFDVSHLTSGKTRRSLFKFAVPEPSSFIKEGSLKYQPIFKKMHRLSDNHETTQAIRGAIIGLHIEGMTKINIANRLGVHRNTVCKWISRFENEGTLQTRYRPGGPRCTTQELDRAIVQEVVECPIATAVDIKNDLNLQCSGSTIRRRLQESNIEPRVPAKKLKLTEHHKNEKEEKNENYRPTALVEPPVLPLKMHQSKGNDLASPSLLMSMAENQCPLMRPISPTPSDLNDGSLMCNSDLLLPPLSPTDAYPLSAASTVYRNATPNLPKSTLSSGKATSSVVLKSKSKSSKHDKKRKRKILSSSYKNQNKGLEISTRSGKYLKIMPKSNETMELNAGDLEINVSNMWSSQSEFCDAVQEKSSTLLNLDNSSLETLPPIRNKFSLTELSLANNKIDDLLCFTQMTNLKILKLSNNQISDVEPLSKLSHLVYLDLSGNKITSLLKYKPNPECNLQHLDLSNNQISEIGCLKNLSQLTKLFMVHNKISTLKLWGTLLPVLIKELALANNSILNLQDISELQLLESLESLTLANNPCLNDVIIIDSEKNVLNSPISFNHVPYILYWCPSLTEIDGKKVTVHDSLKVNWLKKDGNIKRLMSEDKGKLLTFLSTVCPAGEVPVVTSSNYEIVPLLVSTAVNLPQPAFELLNNNETNFQMAAELEAVESSNSGFQAPKRQGNKRDKNNLKQGCVSSSCNHYIELIEEKARCHKLQRKNEDLLERIQILESIIDDNQIIINDLEIKVEEEDE